VKISISKIYLKPALDAARKAVSPKSTLPILSYLKLEAEKNTLSIAGTNLEMGILSMVGCVVESPGAVCVPAKMFCDFVDTYPDEKIILETKPGFLLEMTCANNVTALKILEADEFPPIAVYRRGGASIRAADLKQIIHQTEFAASRDEARPVMQCVQVISSGGLRMIATDGFRIAAAWREDAPGVAEQLIPALSLRKVGELAGEEDEISYRVEYGRAVFTGPAWQVECSVVEGNFPDYEAIRPKSWKTSVVVSAAELDRAIKRAAILSDLPVRIHVQPAADGLTGRIVVMGFGEETGTSETALECRVEGPEMIAAFNPKFLKEGLLTLGHPMARLAMNNPKSPAMLTPADQPKGGGMEYVIMPMHVG